MIDVEIQLKGQIDTDWSNRFGGLAIIHSEDGDTVIKGPIRDQQELRGVLAFLADLGLELVSVTTRTNPYSPSGGGG